VFYVSRQSYFYDEGAYGVEVATKLDYVSPGELGPMYGDAIAAYEDPREAATAAIELAKRWRGEVGAVRLPGACFTIANNALVYPTVADAMNAREVRAWACRRWEGMPKCERCGDVEGVREWRSTNTDETVVACGESCAEALLDEAA
jgi:hypothetical protein